MFEIISCTVCANDARAALQCSDCRGFGAWLRDGSRQYVWSVNVDRDHGRLRTWQRRWWNSLARMSFIFGVSCLLVWAFVLLSQYAHGQAIYFVQAPLSWFVTAGKFQLLWWGGWSCLTIALAANGILKTIQQLPDLPSAGTVDVSRFFLSETQELLDLSRDIAQQTGRTQVTVEHILAAFLTSTEGGMLLSRLEINYDQLRDHLSERLRHASSGSYLVFSISVRDLLLVTASLALSDGAHWISPIDIFTVMITRDNRIVELFQQVGVNETLLTAGCDMLRIARASIHHEQQLALARRQFNHDRNFFIPNCVDDLTSQIDANDLHVAHDRSLELGVLQNHLISSQLTIVVGQTKSGKTSLLQALVGASILRSIVTEEVVTLWQIRLPEFLAAKQPHIERIVNCVSAAAQQSSTVLVIDDIEPWLDLDDGTGQSLFNDWLIVSHAHNVSLLCTCSPTTFAAIAGSLPSTTSVLHLEILNSTHLKRAVMRLLGDIEHRTETFFSVPAIAVATQAAEAHSWSPGDLARLLETRAMALVAEHGARVLLNRQDIVDALAIPQSCAVNAADPRQFFQSELPGCAVSTIERLVRLVNRHDVMSRRPLAARLLIMGAWRDQVSSIATALAKWWAGSVQAVQIIHASDYHEPRLPPMLDGLPIRYIQVIKELELAQPDTLTNLLQLLETVDRQTAKSTSAPSSCLLITSSAGSSFLREQFQLGHAANDLRTILLEQELRGVFRPEWLQVFDDILILDPIA